MLWLLPEQEIHPGAARAQGDRRGEGTGGTRGEGTKRTTTGSHQCPFLVFSSWRPAQPTPTMGWRLLCPHRCHPTSRLLQAGTRSVRAGRLLAPHADTQGRSGQPFLLRPWWFIHSPFLAFPESLSRIAGKGVPTGLCCRAKGIPPETWGCAARTTSRTSPPRRSPCSHEPSAGTHRPWPWTLVSPRRRLGARG